MCYLLLELCGSVIIHEPTLRTCCCFQFCSAQIENSIVCYTFIDDANDICTVGEIKNRSLINH